MTTITDWEASLNQMILAGQLVEAFECFYADDASMQENDEPPTIGKAANRARIAGMVAAVEQVHSVELHGCACGDGVSYSEWTFDLSFVGGVRRVTHQVAARRWHEGLIVSERFYYGA